MRKAIIFVTVVIIILVSLIFLRERLFNTAGQNDKIPSLGEQIYTKVKNPLEDKLPNTNPFTAETNPAKKVYPNPFDRL